MPRPSLLKRIARLSSSPSLARAIASSNSPMEIDSVVEEHDTTPHMQRKEKNTWTNESHMSYEQVPRTIVMSSSTYSSTADVECTSSFAPFDYIPIEITTYILSFLDYRGLLKASQICKLWHEECEREEIWKRVSERIWTQNKNEALNLPKGKTWKWLARAKLIAFTDKDFKEGVGSYSVEKSYNYTGEWKNNKKHGYGFLTYEGGDKYEGEFVDDERHGNGKFIVAKTGSTYEGYWERDYRHGYGVYKWNNGDVYQGQFVKHNRQGYGVYEWPSKDRYEGQFEENAKHGKGCFYFSNGDKFEGEYTKGKRNGKGVYTWPHGDKFIGTYCDDVRNGYGTYYYSYGGKYDGTYKGDKRHGKGVFTWPDGEHYIGVWENESRRGSGSMYLKNGAILTLNWDEKDDANYAYSIPDKYPTADNCRPGFIH